MRKTLTFLLSAMLVFALAAPAASHDVTPEEAGHPIRVAGYIGYPIGFVLYNGLVRPLHWFISLPGARDVFGHKEDIFQQKPWEPAVCKVAPVPSSEAAAEQPPPLEEEDLTLKAPVEIPEETLEFKEGALSPEGEVEPMPQEPVEEAAPETVPQQPSADASAEPGPVEPAADSQPSPEHPPTE